MPASFDLNIFPISRLEGKDQTGVPGLYAATPTHRPARGRDRDNLILYLSLEDPARLPAEQQTQLLTRLAQTFYKTPGTVTSVLRKLAEMLNHSLLEWNVNHLSSQAFAFLTQMVIRDELVYLAHSGPGHAFLMTPEGVQDFSDLEDSGRGLGFGRLAVLRYFQFTLRGAEFLLLTHQPGEIWQVEALHIAPNQGMESVRRKLLVGRTDPTLNAVLIQAVSGTGKLRFLRLKTSLQDMARPHPVQPQPGVARPPQALSQPEGASDAVAVSTQAPLEIVTPSQPQSPEASLSGTEAQAGPAPPIPVQTDPAASASDLAGPPAPVDVAPSLPPPQPALGSAAAGSTTPGRRPSHPGARQPAPKKPYGQSRRAKPSALAELNREIRRVLYAGLRVIETFLAAIANALRQVGSFLFTWLRRVLPDESMVNLSPRALIFIAIAVPLVVSVIGGMVYIERGQAAQYQRYYDQATQASALASSKTDPVEQRLAWQATLDHLDQAEFYRLTPESQALRLQAQNALDLLDGIERLDYQPAMLANLDKAIKVTRLATHGGDLYLLNGVQGNVIRAVLTGGGYQIDVQFVCGPVGSGAAVVGPLVDIVPLPRGEESGATLLGVDASGTLILCIPGEQPLIQPVNPPGINFGEIRAFDLNAGDLYYLDPSQNAVWIYRRRETANPPRLFFGEEIPHMQNVIDLTINDDDLYLLHADGHQSLCTYLPDSATRCDDPLNYVDMRPGRGGGPVIPDALFSQLQFAPPPDPSLYLLEPKSQAIYHFSLRLALQRQYQPLQPLPEGPATAFTISVNRMVFLAIGNQVFYAALP